MKKTNMLLDLAGIGLFIGCAVFLVRIFFKAVLDLTMDTSLSDNLFVVKFFLFVVLGGIVLVSVRFVIHGRLNKYMGDRYKSLPGIAGVEHFIGGTIVLLSFVREIPVWAAAILGVVVCAVGVRIFSRSLNR